MMARTIDRRQVLGTAVGAGLALTGSRLAAAQATPSASPAASPVAGLAAGPVRLASMLAATPAHAFSPTGVIWADVAAAWKLAGLEPLRAGSRKMDGAHVRVLQSLATPSYTLEFAMVPDYAKTFGFSPFQIEQGLQIGEPPNIITLLRGAWQQDDLIRAWMASKYKEMTTPAGKVWSWADGPKMDPKEPVSRYGLGTRNNAAFLPDGTVVFGETIEAVTQVLQTAAGKGASLAGDVRIAGLVASAPAALVSSLILPGASLHIDPVALAAGQPAAATEIARRQEVEQQATGKMPQPSFGLLGVTGGAAPHIVIRLAEKDAAAADQAAKVMAYRLDHGSSIVTKRPFSDLLTLVSADGQADPPIARAEFAPTQPPYANLWIKMVYTRDLGLVGW